MEYLNYTKMICEKTIQYQLVWLHVFSKIDIEKNSEFSIYEIVTKKKIPLKTVYAILKFIRDSFNSKDFNHKIGLKNNVIYIYKAEDFNQYVFTERKSRTLIKSKVTTKKTLKNIVKKPIEKLKTLRISGNENLIEIIIEKFNELTGHDIEKDNKEFSSYVNKRLKEGFDIKDFIYVIELKSMQWLKTPMEKHLKARTIFGDKMENYLNEKPTEAKKSNLKNTYDAATEAKSLLRSGKFRSE